MSFGPMLLAALTLLACGDEPAGRRYEIPPRPSVDCDPPENGGECRRDSDCDPTLICARDPDDPGAPPTDLAPTRLGCALPGTGGAPGETCAMGIGCAHGLCAAAGTCVQPCAADQDCGVGMRCSALYVRVAADVFEAARGCVAIVAAPDDVLVVRGAFDPVDWSRGVVWSELPAGRSLSVIMPTCGATTLATTLVTRASTPRTLFDFASARDGAAQANWIEERVNPTSVLVPNGGGSPGPFGYGLTLQTEGEGGADVFTLTRSAGGASIDIDIFYVGANDWVPEGARGPPELAAALDYLDARLSASGLAVGQVRQHEILGGLRRRFGVLETGERPGEEDERGELFALSAGAPGPSIPIFLVRAIAGAVGRSGGIPGPSGIHGTAGSGIVLGLDLITSQTLVERALAHETLHFLGLFHTTEASALVRDPIDDTPVCSPDRDENGDGFLSPDECAGAGAENLMFWAATGDDLTPGQSEVIAGTYVAR